MVCFVCTPCIFLFRCIVAISPCCFKHRVKTTEPFDIQLQLNKKRDGGYFTNYYRTRITTRDTFYTLFALRLRRKGQENMIKYVERLAKYMTASGQVPAGFFTSWLDEYPFYMFENVPIVDANLFFLIMVWWCYEHHEKRVKKLFLHCQRAWHWIDTYISLTTMHEPIGASWEFTRKHGGYTLLTNVLLIQAMRSMEMIYCVNKDQINQQLLVKKHDTFIAKWTPEIYKTQETLPRILAIYWNMVPRNFIDSFNQELQCTYVPLRTAGPVKDAITSEAWIYGQSDLHTAVIWPWIGFLWICVLAERHKQNLAQSWWTSYMEYHHARTLYSIYSKETGLPLRRAFVKAMPAHSVTLAMHMAAHQCIHGTPV